MNESQTTSWFQATDIKDCFIHKAMNQCTRVHLISTLGKVGLLVNRQISQQLVNERRLLVSIKFRRSWITTVAKILSEVRLWKFLAECGYHRIASVPTLEGRKIKQPLQSGNFQRWLKRIDIGEKMVLCRYCKQLAWGIIPLYSASKSDLEEPNTYVSDCLQRGFLRQFSWDIKGLGLMFC